MNVIDGWTYGEIFAQKLIALTIPLFPTATMELKIARAGTLSVLDSETKSHEHKRLMIKIPTEIQL